MRLVENHRRLLTSHFDPNEIGPIYKDEEMVGWALDEMDVAKLMNGQPRLNVSNRVIETYLGSDYLYAPTDVLAFYLPACLLYCLEHELLSESWDDEYTMNICRKLTYNLDQPFSWLGKAYTVDQVLVSIILVDAVLVCHLGKYKDWRRALSIIRLRQGLLDALLKKSEATEPNVSH